MPDPAPTPPPTPPFRGEVSPPPPRPSPYGARGGVTGRNRVAPSKGRAAKPAAPKPLPDDLSRAGPSAGRSSLWTSSRLAAWTRYLAKNPHLYDQAADQAKETP